MSSNPSLTNISVAKLPPSADGLAETEAVRVVGVIESEFLKKLRAKFVGNVAGQQLWPPQAALENGAAAKELAAQEFTDAFRALFLLREDFVQPPGDGAEGSARKLIRELIDETGWPFFNDKVPVPEPWSSTDKRDKFRRYEVSSAMDVLMRLFHAKGAGGGSSDMPPDR